MRKTQESAVPALDRGAVAVVSALEKSNVVRVVEGAHSARKRKNVNPVKEKARQVARHAMKAGSASIAWEPGKVN